MGLLEDVVGWQQQFLHPDAHQLQLELGGLDDHQALALQMAVGPGQRPHLHLLPQEVEDCPTNTKTKNSRSCTGVVWARRHHDIIVRQCHWLFT